MASRSHCEKKILLYFIIPFTFDFNIISTKRSQHGRMQNFIFSVLGDANEVIFVKMNSEKLVATTVEVNSCLKFKINKKQLIQLKNHNFHVLQMFSIFRL